MNRKKVLENNTEIFGIVSVKNEGSSQREGLWTWRNTIIYELLHCCVGWHLKLTTRDASVLWNVWANPSGSPVATNRPSLGRYAMDAWTAVPSGFVHQSSNFWVTWLSDHTFDSHSSAISVATPNEVDASGLVLGGIDGSEDGPVWATCARKRYVGSAALMVVLWLA